MHILKSFSRSVEPACWKPTPVAATFRMKLQDCYLPNSDNSCKHLKIFSTITLRLYSIRNVSIRSASVKVKARLNGVSMDERQTFGKFVILLPRTSLYFELCWTTGVMVNFPLKERPSTFLSCSEPHTSSTRRWGRWGDPARSVTGHDPLKTHCLYAPPRYGWALLTHLSQPGCALSHHLAYTTWPESE